MAISEPISMIPPPKTPLDLPQEADWSEAEDRLGLKFPMDYREIVGTYGSGGFCRFLWLFNPASKNKYRSINDNLELCAWALHEMAKIGGEEVSFYPCGFGYVPIGVTANGDFVLFRNIEGGGVNYCFNPDREIDLERFSEDLSTILASAVSKLRKIRTFPDNWTECGDLFVVG